MRISKIYEGADGMQYAVFQLREGYKVFKKSRRSIWAAVQPATTANKRKALSDLKILIRSFALVEVPEPEKEA